MLLSATTRALVVDHLTAGLALRDLGAHMLKDFDQPERLYQLVIPDLPGDFPPLKTLDAAPILPASAPLLSPITPLVGRKREQAMLRELLASTLQGRGGLVLLGGEAGMGKSSLAASLAGEAETRGALVLVGRCYDLSETPPYGPWREALAGAAAALPADVAEFLSRGVMPRVASQEALFARLRDALAALAHPHDPQAGTPTRRPLLLVLDDLHWSDPASLDLLRHLGRHLAALPVLVVAIYRADEITRRHPLYGLLPVLVREAQAARLALRPLDRPAVEELVARRYALPGPDAARLVAHLLERGEGNPFFAGELLHALEEAGVLAPADGGWSLGDLGRTGVPTLLRQVIDGRLARLGEAARDLLAIAAVIGQEVPLDLWARVAEIDEEALLDTLATASEARLVEETPDGVRARFVHALIREALYEGLTPSRRRVRHRRVGEALAASPGPDPDAVAYHLRQAGDPRATEWLVRAGERAQLAYAWLTAIERYEAALAALGDDGQESAQQGWLRYRIARLRRYGTPRQAIDYLDEALRLAAHAGDHALAAAARYTRGLCLFYAGEYEAAIREMAAGADALEALPPDEQARLDLGPDDRGVPTVTNPRGMLVVALAVSGRAAEALAMGEATREGTPRHTPLGELGWAHHGDRHAGLASAYALAGRPDAARAASARARDIYRAIGNYSTLGTVATVELLSVSLPYYTDRPDEHRRLAEEAAEANQRASTTAVHHAHVAHIAVLALTGRWSEARAEAEAAMQTGMRSGLREYVAPLLGALAREQGEPGVAWPHIRTLLPSGPQTAPGTKGIAGGLALLRLAAALCLDAADLTQARAWLAAHDRWLAWSGAVLGQAEGQLSWAGYHRAAGDLGRAHDHAERALAHASEPRQPLALLAAHRLLGELATTADHHAEAAAHLDQALVLADACAAPYERALTLLATAELRMATGQNVEARALLDEVGAICAPLGAKPALARVAALEATLAGGVER